MMMLLFIHNFPPGGGSPMLLCSFELLLSFVTFREFIVHPESFISYEVFFQLIRGGLFQFHIAHLIFIYLGDSKKVI